MAAVVRGATMLAIRGVAADVQHGDAPVGRLVVALVIGVALIVAGAVVIRKSSKSPFARSSSLGESKGLALGPALIVGGAVFVALALRDMLGS